MAHAAERKPVEAGHRIAQDGAPLVEVDGLVKEFRLGGNARLGCGPSMVSPSRSDEEKRSGL